MMKKIVIVFCFSLLASFSLPAQTTSPYSITGKVVDETGAPLIGASVLVEKTSNGALTDLDGKFVLPIQDSCVVLMISYTGFEPLKTKPLCHSKQEVVFTLQVGEVLEEVVVTGIGKGKVARKRSWFRSDRAVMSEEMAPAYAPVNYNDAGIQHNTEEYNLIQENKFLAVQQEPLSTFSIDVDAASYSNLRRFVNNGSLPPRDAIRIEEMVNYFNYDYPQPEDEHPFSVTTELSDCPWNEAHQLLHIGLQGKQIPTDDLPASNLVFLIDVSGSMEAANMLALFKSSFNFLEKEIIIVFLKILNN